MADLEDIIAQQVHAVESGEIDPSEEPETSEETGQETGETTTEETSEVVEGAEDSPEEEAATEAEEKDKGKVKDEPEDEIEKILADAGIKPPVEGQRENRIPYSRTRKIIGNALKKDRAKQAELLTAKEKEFEPLKAKATAADNWDRLIASDADRTIRELARIHPQLYGKYLEPRPETKPSTEAAAADKLGPKPGPDLNYEDGSKGFSPEQLEKRDAWLIAKATLDANTANRAELDKRLSPFETERKAKEAYDANLPKVRADRDRCVKLYGKLFTDDEALGEKSEILKVMREQKLSIPDAAAIVLIPKLQGNQTKMRADIMKELNQRKAGAQRSTTSPATAGQTRPDPSVVRPTEDVIAEAIRASGLK